MLVSGDLRTCIVRHKMQFFYDECFFIVTKRLVHGALMFRKILIFTSKKEGEIINLTSEVNKAVRESGIEEGLVHLFVQHSTAALTTIEFEPGVLSDLGRALSVLAPDDATYAHNARWVMAMGVRM